MTSADKTFVAFTPEQAAAYAAGRGGSYPPPLYQAILTFHTGPHDAFLDVGSGPGKVVFDLLPQFRQGIGCDNSVQMIEQAKKDAAHLGVAERARFVVCSGEDCMEALEKTETSRVDLITVAMAAHWLDLPKFYASAAKALPSDGTLAMWTCSSMYCHPSVPNRKAVQAILDDLENNILQPYLTPGNILSRNAYETLSLPWTMDETKGLFDKNTFTRKDWDRDGVPSAPTLADGSPGPFLFGESVTFEQLEESLGSASLVIRWRQANPETAHTDADPVTLTIRRLRDAADGAATLLLSPSCSLLLMRRA